MNPIRRILRHRQAASTMPGLNAPPGTWPWPPPDLATAALIKRCGCSMRWHQPRTGPGHWWVTMPCPAHIISPPPRLRPLGDFTRWENEIR